MKTQTIKIKNGKVYGSGDRYSLRLDSGEIVNGKMKPTFGYKLRRFFKRPSLTANAQIDRTITIAALPEPTADQIPVIGLEEWV